MPRARRASERDATAAALAQAREEARILRARMERMDPRRRPHYAPEERLAILLLRAAAGWTAAETARRFALTEATIASWMLAVHEGGESALVRFEPPVNRFPQFVAELVRGIKATLPTLGKLKIAQMLARHGVHLAASTVKRMLARDVPPERPRAREHAEPKRTGRVVTARHPHHVWHVDLTVLPLSGLWVPWLPQSLAQRWPFAVWLACVVDHASRSVVGWSVHRVEPSARDVCAMLDAACERAGRGPTHIVSDRGAQFQGAYREWCARRGTKARFGALGEHGSIAIIERFFGSLKREMWRVLPLVPSRLAAIEQHVAAYVEWYDAHRPHQALGGRTPREVCEGARVKVTRLEPRARYPARRGAKRIKAPLVLRTERLRGQPHLPVFHVTKAA
ncbi:MAG: transposase [Myxococcales bacterium]|nr:transposase [Myxococcales bacterium]